MDLDLKLKHKHRELELKLNLSLLKPQSPTRLLLSKIILTSSNFFTSTKVISFIQLASFGAGCYIETIFNQNLKQPSNAMAF